MHSEE